MSVLKFFESVCGDTALAKDYGNARDTVIKNSPHLTDTEKAVLKTNDQLLISVCIALEARGSGIGAPGEKGGPPGPWRW